MLFKQKVVYQNIGGKKGRDCTERWNLISAHIEEAPNSFIIDIGSAEGFFTKETIQKTKGRAISVEGSYEVFRRQQKYCASEIQIGSIILAHMELDENSIDLFVSRQYKYCFLLSVLHWFKNPDAIISKLSQVSEVLFIELPELDDKKAWNQAFLQHIDSKYGNLENYITTHSGKNIIAEYKVSSHTSPFRRVFVLK